ncbi:proteoglycan 4-like [Sardina pilchardus]|uniref:proteoglycan 4-like n=1 Tax=Sardina pilchardus TaxID=27697 RepID=UPI002E0F45FD
MNFQNNNSNYSQDGFQRDIPLVYTTQVGGTTYVHGVVPPTGSEFSNQPVITREYQGYQPQQNHGLLGNSTAPVQFQPVTGTPSYPVFNPIPTQGYHGMTLHNGAVALNPQLQGPVRFVDAMGQQHGTSVTFHPQLQVPLVAVGGTGPQYGVPVPNAPHMQAPFMYVSANGQQYVTAVPFGQQLRAPTMLVNRGGVPRSTSLPSASLQAPLMPGLQHGTAVPLMPGLQHGTAVPFNLVPAPSVPVQLINNLQLPLTEQLAAVPSSTGLMRPAPVVQLPPQPSSTGLMRPAPVVQVPPQPSSTGLMRPAPVVQVPPQPSSTGLMRPAPVVQVPPQPSSTGLMRPAPVVQLPPQPRQQTKAPAEVSVCAPSGATTESLKPQATTSKEVEEVKRTQAGQPKAQIEPQQPGTSGSENNMVVKPKSQDKTKEEQPHGAMMDAEVKPADKNTSTKQALKTPAPVEVGKADANLPKEPKSSLPENADRRKEKKRKHRHEKDKKEKRHKKESSSTKKTTKSDEEGSETNKTVGGLKAPEDDSKAKHTDSSNKSTSTKAKEMQPAISLQPKSKGHIIPSAQVFHKLGEKMEKVKPPKPAPEEVAKTSESERPSSSGWQRGQRKIPYPVKPYRIHKAQKPSNALDRPGPSNMMDRRGPSNAMDRPGPSNAMDRPGPSNMMDRPGPSNMMDSPGPSNAMDRPGPSNMLGRAPVRSDADQSRRPEHSQSRHSAPGPKRRAHRPPAPARSTQPYEVPHYFKNHAHGSVGDYGDGERILYPKPGYPGMLPLPLGNLSPLPPGAPRRFHCREASVPIPDERRAEIEARKRKAKRQRDEAAKITRNGMDSSTLADRMNLPHELWPREANWSESELDEVWTL